MTKLQKATEAIKSELETEELTKRNREYIESFNYYAGYRAGLRFALETLQELTHKEIVIHKNS